MSINPTPLDTLDQWSLSHAAGYLSWWEVVILRRLLSKGVALVAARADDGEIHSRARALHLMFRWMVAWNPRFMGERGHAWARIIDCMSPAMLREYLGASRRDRKFSGRTDELLAAVRTGTQLSKAARAAGAAKWATLARTLEADVCATCLRCSKQRLVRTGRIVGAPVGCPVIGFADKDIEPCPDCDLMEWARALTQFRLTPEQLPRGPVVRRLRGVRYVAVPMVKRSTAIAAASRIWGDPSDGRAAKAKRRAAKKQRRRKRQAVAARCA